jgi:DNA repair protein RadC
VYSVLIITDYASGIKRRFIFLYHIPVYKVMLVRDKNQPSNIKQITGAADTYDILKSYLEGQDRENFVILILDTKLKVVGINTVSVGSINQAVVHPREVFKPAILKNASALILGHNHPSGDPAPSSEDIKVTQKLIDAGNLLGIPVIDHIIVCDDAYFSFKNGGVI